MAGTVTTARIEGFISKRTGVFTIRGIIVFASSGERGKNGAASSARWKDTNAGEIGIENIGIAAISNPAVRQRTAGSSSDSDRLLTTAQTDCD